MITSSTSHANTSTMYVDFDSPTDKKPATDYVEFSDSENNRASQNLDYTTEQLLDNRSNPVVSKKGLLFPIKWAINNKNYLELDSLLEEAKNSGFDINAPIDDLGNTLLHFATKKDSKEILQVLINHDADLTAKNSEGFTPLGQAEENSIAAEFLDKIYKKHKELKKNVKKQSDFSLPNIVNNYSVSESMNNQGMTPLHLAIEANDTTESIRLMQEDPSLINKQNSVDFTPLGEALENSEVEFPVSESMQDLGMTPLHLAIESGDENKAIRFIKVNPACIHAKTSIGLSPLHFACQTGNQAIIKALIEYGANVNEQNNEGKTPLHFLAIYNHPESILLFKEKGNFNLQDNDGMTPLHFAAMMDHGEVAKKLKRHGALVSIRNKYKKTPLHVRDISFFIDNNTTKAESTLIAEKKFHPFDYFASTLIQGFFYGSILRTTSISIEAMQNTFTEMPSHINQMFFISVFSAWIITSATINTLLRVHRGYVPSIKRRIVSETFAGAFVLSTAYLSGNLATIDEVGRLMIELYATELFVKKVIFPVASFCIKFWKRNCQTRAPLLLDAQTSAPLLLDERETAAILRKKIKESREN